MNSWFFQALGPKLKFRAVNEKEAINDLGEVAMVGPGKEAALKNIIDYVVAAGLADRDPAGMLRAGNVEGVPAAGQPDQPLPPPPPATGGESKTVKLASGGTLVLSATTAFLSLTQSDRAFVFELIDKLAEYEKKHSVTNASDGGVRDDAHDREGGEN